MESSLISIAITTFVGVVILALFVRSRKNAHDGGVVVITGGSAGIGLSYAKSVVKNYRPKRVVLIARNLEVLKRAQSELKSISPSVPVVDVIQCDVADHSQVDTIVEKISDVTVLVNCAGLSYPTELDLLSIAQIETMIRTNLLGSIYLTRRLIPYIKASSGPCKRIVFISSQAGQVGLYGYTAYSATKFALRGLAEALHMELKPHNVAVCVAYPPDTKTEAFERENEIKPEATRRMSGDSPMDADDVGAILARGIDSGNFSIWFNFDGFMLTQVTCGFSPPNGLWHLFYQTFLVSIFRVVAVGYLAYFGMIARKYGRK